MTKKTKIGRKFKPEERADLIATAAALRDQGIKVQHIADHLGVAWGTARDFLAEHDRGAPRKQVMKEALAVRDVKDVKGDPAVLDLLGKAEKLRAQADLFLIQADHLEEAADILAEHNGDLS